MYFILWIRGSWEQLTLFYNKAKKHRLSRFQVVITLRLNFNWETHHNVLVVFCMNFFTFRHEEFNIFGVRIFHFHSRQSFTLPAIWNSSSISGSLFGLSLWNIANDFTIIHGSTGGANAPSHQQYTNKDREEGNYKQESERKKCRL